MGLFAIGLLAYAAAQLKTALRDLAHGFALRRHAWAAPAEVGGPVRLRGRVRGLRLLSPPAGGAQLVAWEARGAYGFGDDAESGPFVLEPEGASADGQDHIHVDARRLVLLSAEATDNFSNRLRALAPDDQVEVLGWLEAGADGRRVLRDLPGRGVVVAAPERAVVANLVRAAGAFVAVALFVVVAITAHLP
jgi:hypothetical protein